LLRDHEVEIDEKSQLVSLLGGKWTTYRLMAKDTVDQVDGIFGQQNACTTDAHILAGGEDYYFESWKELMSFYALKEEVCKHLVSKYGSRARQVCNLIMQNSDLKEPLHEAYPYIKAEVVYAVRNEMAILPRDFLARRVRFEITNWQATMECLGTVCDLMEKELQWTPVIREAHEAEYLKQLKEFMHEAGLQRN
jgi:glycerol-3-phosphate dehydrogenase